MNLIIGGAYQGKTEYAMAKFILKKEEVVSGKTASVSEIIRARAIKDFQIFIKKILLDGENITLVIEKIIAENPELIIITDEIGNGIVPIDKEERKWREETGRACTIIAKKSETVTRVYCGIPTLIKG